MFYYVSVCVVTYFITRQRDADVLLVETGRGKDGQGQI